MKYIRSLATIAFAASISGCAVTPFQSGAIFSHQTMPVDAPGQASCAKKGTGSAVNVLGLIAVGDAGIASAKKSAGISKVDSVDVSHTGVLGIFGLTKVEVCGE